MDMDMGLDHRFLFHAHYLIAPVTANCMNCFCTLRIYIASYVMDCTDFACVGVQGGVVLYSDITSLLKMK